MASWPLGYKLVVDRSESRGVAPNGYVIKMVHVGASLLPASLDRRRVNDLLGSANFPVELEQNSVHDPHTPDIVQAATINTSTPMKTA